MAESSPIFPLINEETARLKLFEAFMRGMCLVLLLPPCIIPTKSIIRLELEQQTYVDSNIAHEPRTYYSEKDFGPPGVARRGTSST